MIQAIQRAGLPNSWAHSCGPCGNDRNPCRCTAMQMQRYPSPMLDRNKEARTVAGLERGRNKWSPTKWRNPTATGLSIGIAGLELWEKSTR